MREYYLDRLHVKDVIPICEQGFTDMMGEYRSEGIRHYLERHEVTGVDASVVEDLIHSEDKNSYWDDGRMQLYVALEGTDPEAEIQQLIDDMVLLDHKTARVDIWSSLDGISVSREPEEDRRALLLIDHQLISGVDYSARWSIIKPVLEDELYSGAYKAYQGITIIPQTCPNLIHRKRTPPWMKQIIWMRYKRGPVLRQAPSFRIVTPEYPPPGRPPGPPAPAAGPPSRRTSG